MTSDDRQQNQSEDFLRRAEGRSGGFLRDYLDFLRDKKRLCAVSVVAHRKGGFARDADWCFRLYSNAYRNVGNPLVMRRTVSEVLAEAVNREMRRGVQ